MDFTLEDGVYQVSVANNSWTFQERLEGALPDTFIIDGDVHVDFVEVVRRQSSAPSLKIDQCKPDFRHCINSGENPPNTVHSTDAKHKCERYRWGSEIINSKSQAFFEGVLPCKDVTARHVKIQGAPKYETRIQFYFKGGVDILCHVDCRFDNGRDHNKMYLAARLNGGWKGTIRPQGFPFKLNKKFLMDFTLKDGTYKLSVGGISWIFKELLAGASPDTVIVRGAVDVDFVEVVN